MVVGSYVKTTWIIGVGSRCRNVNKFATANEFELKIRDTNFFYNYMKRKTCDRNTCNRMWP